MGNSTSRVAGCFAPFGGKCGKEIDVGFLEQLDEGLGHSFCYVRPFIFESPVISPSNSERFTVDSSTVDSDAWSGSFRHDMVEDPSILCRASIPSKTFPETTFKTISGASVSANVSTARTGNRSALFTADVLEPAASFESTSSFSAIPLQPLPRSSGPLNGFMSGPLERGFASGPLEKGGGFMSGPIQKGIMSGPLEASDKTNFSAPLARGRRKAGLKHLMRSVSGPMRNTLSRTFSKHSLGSIWKQRFFMHPMTQAVWHPREPKTQMEAPSSCCEVGESEVEYGNTRNLQWAHGKAGEDRVHVVLSEEQGWLFIGIYDGFSGPDAPDFLMSHLYRTLDKELEGVLWDYEDQSPNDLVQPETSKSVNMEASSELVNDQSNSHSSVPHHNLGESFDLEIASAQSANCEIVEEKDEASISVRQKVPLPMAALNGQGRKSMRLYELLQMERGDGKNVVSVLQAGNGRGMSEDFQPSLDTREAIQEEQLRSYSLDPKCDSSSHCNEDPATSGEDGGIGVESVDKCVAPCISDSGQRQSTRASLFTLKLKQMYRKQKSLRKKLFPWNYDWHREENFIDERISESAGPIWRYRSGVADHDAVLKAMARALQRTEEAYVEMVEKALDKYPELCLMGSCVLVMLMKDQDVYVMNLGDSRVILAQERPNDRHPNPSFVKDDVRHRNRSRESLVRMELDRISEESPMHNRESQDDEINKKREIAVCRLRMKAVQLSTDHSTSVEEEVSRVKAEHPDDNQAIFNDRVKGQLKVTRAFGAEFLKKPTYNDVLLKRFRVEYVGTGPYVSCIPSVFHHRLSSSDRFLVLSSDGLYQYFSNEEVVAHVTWFMENVPGGDPAQYLIAELLFRAAKKNGMDFHELLDIPQGDRRKYHDDVSVMVVSLEGRIWRSCG